MPLPDNARTSPPRDSSQAGGGIKRVVLEPAWNICSFSVVVLVGGAFGGGDCGTILVMSFSEERVHDRDLAPLSFAGTELNVVDWPEGVWTVRLNRPGPVEVTKTSKVGAFTSSWRDDTGASD